MSRSDGRLTAPEDDGAADHLSGCRVPSIELPASDGRRIHLDEFGARIVVFVYPGIGGPGRDDLLEAWTALPGARGCTPEACGFRDELTEFRAEGVEVFGLSSQSSSSQREHAQQLELPYPLLSDESLRLREALGLPSFDFHGRRYFKRLTLIVNNAIIEAALYPVFPPEQGAAHALEWLRQQPR
jgi:peroxiredoxin